MRRSRGIQELDGGFLLELEPVAHGVAGIDEKSDLERQIGFTAEAADFRRACCRR